MKYRITHRTEYKYTHPVTGCYNMARLIPGNFPGQQCQRAQVLVEPAPSSYREFTDHFGNRASYFDIQHSHRQMSVICVSEVLREEVPPFPNPGPNWTEALELLRAQRNGDEIQVREYLLPSPLIRPLRPLTRYVEEFFVAEKPVRECILAFGQAIYEEFEYDPEFSDIATPLSDVMDHRRGVCQDFAHLAIAGIRAMGLPAGYVSGYLETLPPPGKEKLRGADASHAWFRAYVPDLGWFEFDPTNNMEPALQHVVLAYGRDYADVAPLRGVIQGGGKHEIKVAVDMEQIPAGKADGH